MTIEEVNEYADSIDEEIVVFSHPSYNNSILGISTDNRVIYDYDLMIKDLMEQDNISVEEAEDFIQYNTIGASYSKSKDPIILFQK